MVAGTTQVKPKRGRGRPTPSPQSILNREALVQALDARDIFVKPEHLDGFYQALHRQHYPPLADFVDQYYRNEDDAKRSKRQPAATCDNGIHTTAGASTDDNIMSAADAARNPQEAVVVTLPLKNPITNRKNRNRKTFPKAFLEFLAKTDEFVTVTSKIAKVKTSADRTTTKLAVQLHDGQLVESVLMRYGPLNEDGVVKKCGRASLCVSSQVGCAMACNFCATGMMGLTGNLHYAEILEQVIHAGRILSQEALERRQAEPDDDGFATTKKKKSSNNKSLADCDLDIVRNIVFMGMGEPLDNYNNVVSACGALIDRRRWNLAHGRVTISTVGIASKIRQLTKDLPEVSLALSLHAPNQRLRSEIVPTAKHYPIEDMIDALDGHMKAAIKPRPSDANTHHRSRNVKKGSSSARRRAMIEYVMLETETSSLECAHELGKLCENRNVVVNLIPYNQTGVKDKLRCPSEPHIREFQRIVSSYRVFCTIRRTMGADIDSACGQLIVSEQEKQREQEQQKVVDIEDSPMKRNEGGLSATRSSAVVRKSPQSMPTKELSRDVTSNSHSEPIDLDRWIIPLQIATTIAASCFLVSSALYLTQQRR